MNFSNSKNCDPLTKFRSQQKEKAISFSISPFLLGPLKKLKYNKLPLQRNISAITSLNYGPMHITIVFNSPLRYCNLVQYFLLLLYKESYLIGLLLLYNQLFDWQHYTRETSFFFSFVLKSCFYSLKKKIVMLKAIFYGSLWTWKNEVSAYWILILLGQDITKLLHFSNLNNN